MKSFGKFGKLWSNLVQNKSLKNKHHKTKKILGKRKHKTTSQSELGFLETISEQSEEHGNCHLLEEPILLKRKKVTNSLIPTDSLCSTHKN